MIRYGLHVSVIDPVLGTTDMTVWTDTSDERTRLLKIIEPALMNFQYINQNITARVSPPNTTIDPGEVK